MIHMNYSPEISNGQFTSMSLSLSNLRNNSEIELCGPHPANQTYWTQETGEPEISCKLITDTQTNTGRIDIHTGSHTYLSTQDICTSITADLKEQRDCNKKLKDLSRESGTVSIVLDNNGVYTWKPEILWDRPEYSAFNLTDALLQASYTQDAPPRDPSQYLDAAKEPAVIMSTALVVIAAISYISYWATRSWIKKPSRGSAKSGTSSQVSQSDAPLGSELPANSWTRLPVEDRKMNQKQKKSPIQDTPSIDLMHDKSGNQIWMPRAPKK